MINREGPKIYGEVTHGYKPSYFENVSSIESASLRNLVGALPQQTLEELENALNKVGLDWSIASNMCELEDGEEDQDVEKGRSRR